MWKFIVLNFEGNAQNHNTYWALEGIFIDSKYRLKFTLYSPKVVSICIHLTTRVILKVIVKVDIMATYSNLLGILYNNLEEWIDQKKIW